MKYILNLTKFGVSKWGLPPNKALQNLKLLNPLSWRHENFKVTIYKKKIKFDQIRQFQNWRSPQNKAAKIQNFLTILVTQMKFLGLTITKIR